MKLAGFVLFLLLAAPAAGQVYFDGLYEARDANNPSICYYLRFFPDGSVQGVVSKPNSTEEVGQWFHYTKFNTEINKGYYVVADGKIEIITSFVRKDVDKRYITVDFLRGEITGTGESLKLTHTFYDERVRSGEEIFHFNNFKH